MSILVPGQRRWGPTAGLVGSHSLPIFVPVPLFTTATTAPWWDRRPHTHVASCCRAIATFSAGDSRQLASTWKHCLHRRCVTRFNISILCCGWEPAVSMLMLHRSTFMSLISPNGLISHPEIIPREALAIRLLPVEQTVAARSCNGRREVCRFSLAATSAPVPWHQPNL